MPGIQYYFFIEIVAKELYFIAVLPPIDLREKVRNLKLEMQRRFQAGHALKSPAHITLQMPFRLEEKREAELYRVLDNFAGQQPVFSVQIRGFDCFPPRVIFLRVVDHHPFVALQKALKTVLIENEMIPRPSGDHRFHPHMTIATRDLDKSAFEEAWPEFKVRPFNAGFTVRSLCLLKHNGSYWDIYRQAGFSPDRHSASL